MDYDKPEALNPQIYHHAGHQSPQPDGEATLHGFDEPPVPEDKREFRSDSLWYASVRTRPLSLDSRLLTHVLSYHQAGAS
jgi:hypothetical protein